MECPDDETLQGLLAGRVPQPRADAHWAHIEQCAACRALLSALPERPKSTQAPSPDPQPGDSVSQTLRSPVGRAPVASDDEGPLQGALVGRYVIESLIGAGGFGRVYAADDPQLRRSVAVKIIRSGAVAGLADSGARLIREARAMARIAHPNVVAVFDAGPWNQGVFVAMERVDGADLAGWLAQKRRTVSEVVDAFCAAGRGLAAAHAAGLIHRDFKPGNVLVGTDGRVRVTDFGIARAAPAPVASNGGSTLEPLDVDARGVLIGTVPYMAPEQLLGEHLDFRADQFAFCASMYEALHGVRPFPGQVKRRLDALREGPPPAPPDSQVPASLSDIVSRGLAADPAERWPSMEALLAALERDRSRGLRAVATVAAASLMLVVVALGGDAVVRARSVAAARESFAAASQRVERTLALRYEAFEALADLSTLLPVVRQVAAARDESDFGLGTGVRDADRFAALHASLKDADWTPWRVAAERANVAVADYKGRLCYSTARPDRWGNDLFAIPAVARAFDLGAPASSIAMLPNRLLAGTGLLADEGQAQVAVLFVRALELGGARPAAFLQLIAGDHLLGELAVDPQTQLALVLPDGTVEGPLPRELIGAVGAHPRSPTELVAAGRTWLVQSSTVPGASGAAEPIAVLVLARPADTGLSGLFPHARAALSVIAVAALALLAGSLWRMRVNARRLTAPALRNAVGAASRA